jgi:hypothetical protein
MSKAEAPEIPQPTFPHRAYGVGVTSFGEEGGYMAQGHVPGPRFLAACNHLARTELGLRNACDDTWERAEMWLLNVEHVWAVPVDPAECNDEFAWAVDWSDATKDTPGAIPVTVWEP